MIRSIHHRPFEEALLKGIAPGAVVLIAMHRDSPEAARTEIPDGVDRSLPWLFGSVLDGDVGSAYHEDIALVRSLGHVPIVVIERGKPHRVEASDVRLESVASA